MSDAPMPSQSPAALAVHVTLRWRGDALAVRRLQGEAAAAVGAHPDAIAPIPCAPGLAEGFVFARTSRGAAAALAPGGAMVTVRRASGVVDLVEGPATIPLVAGDVAELVVGEFRLEAAADVPEVFVTRRRRASGAWGAVAAAALAHAVAFGLAAQEAQASSADDREEDRTIALRDLLASAETRTRGHEVAIEDGMGSGEGRIVNEQQGDGRPGGGERAIGGEGAMGDRLGHAGEHRRYAVPRQLANDPEPSVARAESLVDAAEFGMIGLLAQGPRVPSAAFADTWAHGVEDLAANGALWASDPGAWESGDALGLLGVGEGGGGRGEGIGLGKLGTIGHTAGAPGSDTGGRGSRPAARRLKEWGKRSWTYRCGWGSAMVSGRLPPETIQRIVRQNAGRVRACYEDGLRQNPSLQGRVTVSFVIGRDGSVSSVGDGGSDLPDTRVVACVERAFYALSFPQPEGGIVTVKYPLLLSPE